MSPENSKVSLDKLQAQWLVPTILIKFSLVRLEVCDGICVENETLLVFTELCLMLFLLVDQDVEVPLHLLRYVCLFCGKHGLSLMKECFELGSPESLPFPIAHAFITIVSNVSPATKR